MGLSPNLKESRCIRLTSGVIVKITLAIFRGVVTDNLNGILVGTDSTIRSQTVEFTLICSLLCKGNLLFERERLESHVIYDTNGETILGSLSLRLSNTAIICAGLVSFEERPCGHLPPGSIFAEICNNGFHVHV